MSLEITDFTDINAFIQNRTRNADNSLFQQAVEEAIAGRETAATPLTGISGVTSGYVVVSQNLEDKLKTDPDLAEELAQKIAEMSKCYGKSCRDNIVVVDRNGEIARYCPKHDKPKDYPTSEELKALAKARARKKARLDAYFKLVERISVKRKLIEQENIKRGTNKKYRCAPGRIDLIARSILQKPTKEPEYYC